MNRETEQHFSQVPEIHIPRSKVIKEHDLLTSFDVGQIVPIYVDPDILPGTTVNMKMSCVMRMQTPLFPTMGNMSADILFFFIPYRLVWTGWKAMWGENTNAWYPQTEKTVPQLYAGLTGSGFTAKSLADYMGMPTGVANIYVNHLPFRCYVKCFNDWFRDTNLQQEVPSVDSDSNVTFNASTTYLGGPLLNANKYHDYFTSCLPTSQYGSPVSLPLGTWAPVMTRNNTQVPEITGGNPGLTWKQYNNTNWATGKGYNLRVVTPVTAGKNATTISSDTESATSGTTVYPSNLWADLSNATAATITTLRQAIAIQHFYEAQARGGGGRYITFLKNIFNVTSPDGRLQRSEYLGGKRIGINIYQATQQSETGTSPLGTTGAFSHTADADEYFTWSSTEHGCLMGLLVVRYNHSYQQGIPRGWSRKHWYDYYVPQLANLSEMAVLNKELVAQGTTTDEEAFGYQEAWADYRYFPDTVTGEMRSNYSTSLDSWHYADDYNTLPTLGSSWIQEDKTNIDRTLAVSSSVSNQMWGDFYFKPTYVMPMPVYSVPGLGTI